MNTVIPDGFEFSKLQHFRGIHSHKCLLGHTHTLHKGVESSNSSKLKWYIDIAVACLVALVRLDVC